MINIDNFVYVAVTTLLSAMAIFTTGHDDIPVQGEVCAYTSDQVRL